MHGREEVRADPMPESCSGHLRSVVHVRPQGTSCFWHFPCARAQVRFYDPDVATMQESCCEGTAGCPWKKRTLRTFS